MSTTSNQRLLRRVDLNEPGIAPRGTSPFGAETLVVYVISAITFALWLLFVYRVVKNYFKRGTCKNTDIILTSVVCEKSECVSVGSKVEDVADVTLATLIRKLVKRDHTILQQFDPISVSSVSECKYYSSDEGGEVVYNLVKPICAQRRPLALSTGFFTLSLSPLDMLLLLCRGKLAHSFDVSVHTVYDEKLLISTNTIRVLRRLNWFNSCFNRCRGLGYPLLARRVSTQFFERNTIVGDQVMTSMQMEPFICVDIPRDKLLPIMITNDSQKVVGIATISNNLTVYGVKNAHVIAPLLYDYLKSKRIKTSTESFSVIDTTVRPYNPTLFIDDDTRTAGVIIIPPLMSDPKYVIQRDTKSTYDLLSSEKFDKPRELAAELKPVYTPEELYKLGVIYVDLLVGRTHLNSLCPDSTPEVEEQQGRPLQVANRIAARHDLHAGVMSKIMIKNEALKRGKCVRPVTTVDPITAYRDSTVYGPIGRWFKKYDQHYGFGKPSEIVNKVREVVLSKQDGELVEGDISDMDISISKTARDLELYLIHKLFQKKFEDYLNEVHKETYNFRSRGRFGVNFKITYGRGSGRGDTSPFNTLLMNICIFISLVKSGLEPDVAFKQPFLSGGDDTLFRILKPKFFADVCASFGLRAKLETVGADQVPSFLGRRFFISPTNSFCINDPGRALLSLTTTHLVHTDAREVRVRKALSYLRDNPRVPIVSDVCNAIIRIDNKVVFNEPDELFFDYVRDVMFESQCLYDEDTYDHQQVELFVMRQFCLMQHDYVDVINTIRNAKSYDQFPRPFWDNSSPYKISFLDKLTVNLVSACDLELPKQEQTKVIPNAKEGKAKTKVRKTGRSSGCPEGLESSSTTSNKVRA